MTKMTQEDVTDEVEKLLDHYAGTIDSLQKALAMLLERDLGLMLKPRAGKGNATRAQIKTALLEFAEQDTSLNCHTYAGLLTSAFQAFDADEYS